MFQPVPLGSLIVRHLQQIYQLGLLPMTYPQSNGRIEASLLLYPNQTLQIHLVFIPLPCIQVDPLKIETNKYKFHFFKIQSN